MDTVVSAHFASPVELFSCD